MEKVKKVLTFLLNIGKSIVNFFCLIGKKFKSFLRRYKIRNLNRSLGGNLSLSFLLLFFGLFSIWPLVLTINNAFKPLNEIFVFPPKLFVQNPTLDNFRDLSDLIGSSVIPLSRHIYNTLIITFLGTLGSIFISSLAAFPLAKYRFRGSKLLSRVIVYALMFNATVLQIPNYLVVSGLGLVNSVWSIVLPAVSGTLGLYLMKNFITQIPDTLLEAAKIDGANEFYIYRKIIMPLSKPAWITLIILQFNQLWSATGGIYIYDDVKKPLSFALNQIVNAGIARTGTAAAVSLIMLIIPITVFVVTQSNVIETFTTSGIKE